MTMPMNVLEVDEETAKRKLTAYRQAVRIDRRLEDKRIAAGFREIVRGRLVISLRATIEAGGFDDAGVPKLAIARADAKLCRVSRHFDEVVYWTNDDRWGPRGRVQVADDSVRVQVPNPLNRSVSSGGHNYAAIVPVVPPEHRPRRGTGYANLHGYHVLWEANWRRMPMKDPALLRWLGGDLWSVQAVWDLTPLEAAVLTDRANGR